MNRFFIEDSFVDNRVTIKGDDVKHIKNVLRLSIGDQISLCDGNDNEYIAEIKAINNKDVMCEMLSKCDIKRESNIKITLYQALTKGQKMDLIIQKAVELGVNEICPVQTKRCVSVIKDISKENKKVNRWNKIAYEAAKQSKRGIIPSVKNILTFKELLEDMEKLDEIIVPYECEQKNSIKNLLKTVDAKSIGIVIGPEGGFEEEEINMLREKQASIVTLGNRILRTETAGLATIAVIMYELDS
ncbi:16S rRNA (uracil(1498)-N(3))-methyltransferase [Clostridiaceae bacterium M8S5]|nr:16S rRNA (uracil(1498)-N(3))-methyltransferase [Clostridiaceae bacterium M8S5]